LRNLFIVSRFLLIVLLGTVLLCNVVIAQKHDSLSYSLHDSLHYPLQDRRGDPFGSPYYNPFDINDSSIIQQDIEYDPVTNQYYITEKVGDINYRIPTYLTFDEMYRLKSQQQEDDYFNQRAQALLSLNRKISRPPPHVYDKLFDRMFGVGPNGLKVDIKPQGTIDLTMGYQGQVVKNPTLPESARKNGGLDFNMNTNLNIDASIGDKLKLPISYNTLANFDYENQLKLDYKGMDDEILKSVEAGNISFQTKGSLMSSPQSLFGVKTQLQFGKFSITGAIASQKSQQQSLALQGGGLSQNINLKLDDYDENRHFLLAQYFRKNFNFAMSNLPVVNSQVQIVRMEVWVTNRTGITTNTRSVVGFADLGEDSAANNSIHTISTDRLPQNNTNDLYGKLLSNPGYRDPSLVNGLLLMQNLQPVNDYEKTFARKLDSTEYYYNPQVGFLSLNVQLQPDDVLAVAYQYTDNGRVYQVGEFAQDITVDSTQGVQKMLFLKLLKATSARVSLPIWQLMMKNVYSINVTGLQQQDFKLNVLYQEPSGGLKRYLPQSDPAVSGSPLIQILRADRLNNRNDPQPDGLFDFVDGFTVISQQGKVIFPVLQPFGKDLAALAFNGVNPDTVKQYVYQPLYDSIKAIAQTYANLDRYVLQGTVKGSSSTDIYLGAFNIPQGSVTVTAGGQVLQENVDYIIDYNLGTLKVINQAIINSGIPVNVQFENNATYGIQQRSFLGLRLDYVANQHFSIGGTLERLAERPFFTKVNYGEDPIRNTMYGVDFNYQNQLPELTRLINKLPFYNSSAPSSITAYGEAAALKPGHPPQIGKGSEGLIYIDDFEGATSSVDLRFPYISWALASTPQNNGLFPEGTLTNDLTYGKNRAKLAWYNIEPTLQDKTSPNNPLRSNLKELSDPRVRQVYTNELFPQKTTNITDVITTTFDLAYYPSERGPYNFTDDPADVDGNGMLTDPQKRWGGIMRALDQTDFETGNIEYIEFWVQDPFIKTPNSKGGKLYIDLGSISEDILKDGRRFYENGLPTPTIPAVVDATSVWGSTPINPIQVTQAFSNDPNDRPYQDVGFDGLGDDSERVKRKAYLSDIANNFGAASLFYKQASADPSNDDYVWYRDASYDAAGTGILGRYKEYNNPQGNSPIYTGNSPFSPAATLYPDNEDLNHDNTLNETEEYYEYEVDLKPGMAVGNSKYITDQKVVNPRLADGSTAPENWYLFRVPIKDFTSQVGQIPDFKSIRFMRMYMTGFEDSVVVLRFATLDLVRNQWRTFTYNVDTVGAYAPVTSNSSINVLAVNVEENSNRQPIPYVIPPGIERVQELSNNGVNLLQNEQAMSLQINNLEKKTSRAVFKTLDLDLRQYGQMDMFIHAESGLKQSPPLANGNVDAVIRIGQDFLDNYYEVKIPLQITQFGSTTAEQIWPDSNNLNLALNDLVQLKLRRDSKNYPITGYYTEAVGNRNYSVKGNPNLGDVQGILIAIENETTNTISTEVWVNELRLSKIDEKGGYAALGRVDMQLADLGTLTASANTYSYGFGSIDQQISQRALDNMFQYDAALNLDLGKLTPQKLGFSIPVYASINKTILTPEYDPYDLDVLYRDKLNMTNNRDSVKKAATDITTIKTVNFTNVRFGQPGAKTRLWSISNFDFSYSYTEFDETNPTVLKNDIKKYHGGLGYTFNAPSKFKEPFKNVIKNHSAWLAPIRDFNFNYVPSLLSVRYDINRQYGIFIPRIVDTYDSKIERVDTTYDKYFTMDRYYNLRWDFTRSLNLDFSAIANARIDEPYGQLDTKAKKDTVEENFFQAGRNTMYQQHATISYNIPFSKLPITDWINAHYSYTTTYSWTGASLLAVSLGNIIQNSQQNSLTGEFDFPRLYSKSKFFNAVSQPSDNTNNVANPNDSIQPPKPRAEILKDSAGNKLKGFEKRNALQKWRQQKRDYKKQQRKNKEQGQMNGAVKVAGQLITMVKHVSVSYNTGYDSRVPGITTGTGYLGQNQASNQPGYDYIFGRQPDSNWLNQKAREGVITKDSLFNLVYTQDYQQQINITGQLEPFREFNVDLNFQKTFSKNYSELFKNISSDPTNDNFSHLSPLAGGGFSVSYISFQTLFKKSNPNEVSQTFQKFQDDRIIIAKRLANANSYWDKTFQGDGFPTGYGRYQQDVLLPSFIAAYTEKDPNSIPLINQDNSSIKANPFNGIHALPNWRLTYTGLTRIPALANVFSNITITHGYNSTFSMNSFTSSLLYYDPLHLGQPAFIDPISGNYIPYFLIPNLTIQEQFAPLIGIDVTTNNQTALRFEYAKSRQLSLSLYDYQLSEVSSSSVTFGGTYRKHGVDLPFKFPFIKAKPGQTDLNVTLDLALRNDLQTNSRLDQPTAYSTGGQKTISIQPSFDYLINNRIDLKFYFDQQRIIPYISTSAPITNTRAGIELRISIAPPGP